MQAAHCASSSFSTGPLAGPHVLEVLGGGRLRRHGALGMMTGTRWRCGGGPACTVAAGVGAGRMVGLGGVLGEAVLMGALLLGV